MNATVGSLELAYFGGLSQKEISERTGVPLGTVKSRTASAFKALRGELTIYAYSSSLQRDRLKNPSLKRAPLAACHSPLPT
jgi:Sigma-70, region 4